MMYNGGFAGMIFISQATEEVIINDNMSMSCYEGSDGLYGYYGGFVGFVTVDNASVQLKNDYALPCFVNTYKPTVKASFAVIIENKSGGILSTAGSYYYNANGAFSANVLQTNNNGNYTLGFGELYFDDDNLLDKSNTPLIDKLNGEGWIVHECTLSWLGKKYAFPMSHTPVAPMTYPEYCE